NSLSHHGGRTGGKSPTAYYSPLLLDAPTNLTTVVITANPSIVIRLTWTAPSGLVDHYQIERSQSLAGPFASIATSTNTSFDDSSLGSGVHSYLYRVRAVSSAGALSPPSNMAFGTAIRFVDEQLVAQVTEIKAQHIYDLRDAVNAVRALVPGMSAGAWAHGDLYLQFIYA